MPCGFDLHRTLREARILDKNDDWKSLQAVQNNEVYLVNANAYFSKPGPRTIVGLEILAKIINPKLSKISMYLQIHTVLNTRYYRAGKHNKDAV